MKKLGKKTIIIVATILVLGLIAHNGLKKIEANDQEKESNTLEIIKGAQMYDKWYKVLKVDTPKESHPLYPADKKYASSAATNWRCKECHGWDYKGKDGVYSEGSHFTGIKGVSSLKSKSLDSISKSLKSHKGYTLDDESVKALAQFLKYGTIEMSELIDPETKEVKGGDAIKGNVYFKAICAGCHGQNGTEEDMPNLPKLSLDNPWESIHKILYGQPGSAMPALAPFDKQVAVDILKYLQSLNKDTK